MKKSLVLSLLILFVIPLIKAQRIEVLELIHMDQKLVN